MKTTETTTQHTPGPWLAGQTITAADPGRAPGSYERITIASRVNNMANARLIAAAPELLDAVTEFVRLGKAGADTSWHSQDVQPVIYSMLAAIAKATGGAQ